MLSDEEKDNVFKISVPIITNEELERLDYTLENNLDNIVQQISETVSRDKDTIILKKVIEKQSKEIEEYKKQLDLDYVDMHFVPIERYNQLKKEIEELKESKEEMGKVLDEWINGERTSIFHIHKDKIKAKIEELDYNDIGNFERRCKQEVLQSLLEKE